MTAVDTTSSYSTPSLALPKLNVATLGLMFVAGFFATIAFDLWGQWISPALGWAALSPAGLARGFLGALGLPNGGHAGNFMHFYMVGLIGYPVGWLFVFKPVWARVVGDKLGWFVPSALYGAALWVFAIGGITWVAGLPFFLGFSGITWVALAGHVFYGIALVATLRAIVPAEDRAAFV